MSDFPDRYDDIDFRPPESVVANVARGLDLHDRYEIDISEVALIHAKEIGLRKNFDPDGVRRMLKYFHSNPTPEADEGSGEYITYLLYGGEAGHEWAHSIQNKMQKVDSA